MGEQQADSAGGSAGGLRIDAHHHLWDTAERAYPRLSGPGTGPLQGRFAIADLAPLAGAAGIGATIAVEAANSAEETRALLDAAAGPGPVAGVVGWADLESPGIGAELDALADRPGRLVALRHPAEAEPDPDWLGRPAVRRGMAESGRRGLAVDLLVTPAQIGAAVRAVRALPEVRFVLDHLGKPPIAAGEGPVAGPWADGFAALAAEPNTAAKLSGLVTEADWACWTPGDVLPFTDRALELFGPERLMFGTDWPVCTLAAGHGRVVDLAEAATAGLSAAEQAAVFGGTAARVYRLAV